MENWETLSTEIIQTENTEVEPYLRSTTYWLLRDAERT